MSFELLGNDLADPETWPAYTELCLFFEHSDFAGEVLTHPLMMNRFAQEDQEGAQAFARYLLRHESGKIRALGGFMAKSCAVHDPEFAAVGIAACLEDGQVPPTFVGFMEDLLEREAEPEFLKRFSLTSLTKIVAAYKRAKDRIEEDRREV